MLSVTQRDCQMRVVFFTNIREHPVPSISEEIAILFLREVGYRRMRAAARYALPHTLQTVCLRTRNTRGIVSRPVLIFEGANPLLSLTELFSRCSTDLSLSKRIKPFGLTYITGRSCRRFRAWRRQRKGKRQGRERRETENRKGCQGHRCAETLLE